MSSIRKHSRLLVVCVCCVALGAAISAIASAGAATQATANGRADGRRGGHGRLLRRLAARAVHGSIVVKTRTGFGTVTFDRGKVDAVNGRQLTIAEGTAKATYRTVTLTVPAGAVVRDDKRSAGLAALKPGQRVVVVAAPRRTVVIARTPRAG